MYYQTDTHWNRLGAFYVYQLIINRIREDFPQISPTLSIQDFIVETKVDSSGDLVGLIDMKNTFARTTYYLTPKNSSEHELLNIGIYIEILLPSICTRILRNILVEQEFLGADS